MKSISTAFFVLSVTNIYWAESSEALELVGLENVASIIGEKVTFTCLHNLPTDPPVAITWYYSPYDFNKSVIRRPLRGNSSEYRMEYVTNGQSLSINSNNVHNAGIYRCESLVTHNDTGSTHEISAHLMLIVSDPVCTIDKTIANETDSINVQCSLRYNGYWDPFMHCRRIISNTRKEIDNTAIRRNFTRSNNITTLSLVATIQLESQQQSMLLQCDTFFTSMSLSEGFATNVPTYKYTWNSSQIQVLYGVRNVTVVPTKESLYPGEVLICSALGNPEPEIVWISLETGKITSGKELLISDSMIRKENYTYRCRANNSISENVLDVTFLVKSKIPTNTRLTLIATVSTGVVFVVLLVTLGLVALRNYLMAKKKKSSYAVEVARQDNESNEYESNEGLEMIQDGAEGGYIEIPLVELENELTIQQPPTYSSVQDNYPANKEPNNFRIVGADGTEYAQVNRVNAKAEGVPSMSTANQSSMFSRSDYVSIDHTYRNPRILKG